jgi:hypothetical protein
VIRRSFRFGLLLGLLAAVAFALVKVFGPHARGEHVTAAPPTGPWPRLTEDPTVPAPATTHAIPDPDAPVPKAAPVEKAPTKKAAAAKKAPAKRKTPAAKAWVEPTGGVCPTSHPVKAKLSSKIFHLPGMLNYERTTPDRCYADAAKAEADGLRAAKR